MKRSRAGPARDVALCAALVACALASVPSAEAHLLNMTRATLSVHPGGELSLALEIDLTRAFADRAAYHAASRLAAPTEDPAILALAERLTSALRIDTPTGPWESRWRLTTFAAEQASADRYADPFHWPMTELRLVAEDPLPAPALRARFEDGFPIEEPVALTIEAVIDDVRATRWLVVDQWSPVFTLDGTATSFPEPGTAVRSAPTLAPVESIGLAGAARAGFAHILPGGLDHVLFVFLLVLVCRRARPAALAITLFTLAHALTLTLVMLRWAPTPPALVEPLVIASIAWLAVDVLRGMRWRTRHGALVFAFGLLHGLAFAGALGSLPLDTEARAATLLALNLGVEGAQLLVAGATLALLHAASSLGPPGPLFTGRAAK